MLTSINYSIGIYHYYVQSILIDTYMNDNTQVPQPTLYIYSYSNLASFSMLKESGIRTLRK